VRNGLECEKFPFHPHTWRGRRRRRKRKNNKKSHAIKREAPRKIGYARNKCRGCGWSSFLDHQKRCFFRPRTTSALARPSSVMETSMTAAFRNQPSKCLSSLLISPTFKQNLSPVSPAFFSHGESPTCKRKFVILPLSNCFPFSFSPFFLS
jgi:hypothetical protein